jgi:hypothetical protein
MCNDEPVQVLRQSPNSSKQTRASNLLPAVCRETKSNSSFTPCAFCILPVAQQFAILYSMKSVISLARIPLANDGVINPNCLPER